MQRFEQETLERIGLLNPWVPPRYRSTYFSHTFSGGYDAGYFSYIFSEVLDADTVEWFRDNGGLRRANGDHFRAELLSRGRTREPLESFQAFRGRDAAIEPLLARDDIADIMVNGAGRVFIEVQGKVQLTNVRFRDNGQLMNICQRIVSQVGRRAFTTQRPSRAAPAVR